MKKTIKFIIVTTWIILSRGYDLYATAQFTPDLSREANPLVSVFGFGWTPLLLVIGILMIYLVYAYYISIFKQFNLLPTEKGLRFGEFMTYLYLGKKESWISMFYKIPKDINRLNHYMGHIFSKGFIFVGIITTIMWLLINYTDFYYKNYHNLTVIYSIVIIGSLLVILDWNRRLYKQYNENYK